MFNAFGEFEESENSFYPMNQQGKIYILEFENYRLHVTESTGLASATFYLDHNLPYIPYIEKSQSSSVNVT